MPERFFKFSKRLCNACFNKSAKQTAKRRKRAEERKSLPKSLKRHIKQAYADPAPKVERIDSSPRSFTTKPFTMEQHEVRSPASPPVRESKLKKLSEKKFVSIRKYRGEPRVNIRKYIRDSQGKPYATKCGIMLTYPEWEQLEKSFKDIDSSLRNCM